MRWDKKKRARKSEVEWPYTTTVEMKCDVQELSVITVEFHSVRTKISGPKRFDQVLSWEFEPFPDPYKVVVEVTVNACLPGRIGAETLELEWANGERRDSVVPLAKPIPGFPPQELKDAPHFLFEQLHLFIPPSFPRIRFRPLKTKFCVTVISKAARLVERYPRTFTVLLTITLERTSPDPGDRPIPFGWDAAIEECQENFVFY